MWGGYGWGWGGWPYMSYRYMGYGYPAAPVVEEAPVQQVCCPPKKTSATAKVKASAY